MEIPADLAELIQPHTKSPPVRMAAMYEALETIDREGIPGDVVECGVWRGGNLMIARLVSPDRVCWAYDTFSGMTEPDPNLDHKRDGERAIDRYKLKMKGGTPWDAVGYEEVRNSFEAMGLDGPNVKWIVGRVEVTARSHRGQIAILRLDVDWYWPTKVALEELYPKLVPGGFLIVDDYGHWMGCRKAVDDFFEGKTAEMREVDYSCVMMRK